MEMKMPENRWMPMKIRCRSLLTLALLTASACSQNAADQTPTNSAADATISHDSASLDIDLPSVTDGAATKDATTDNQEGPYPQVLMKTSLGDITVKLDAEKAPIAVDNFLKNYVVRGFYDGTIIHYVEPEKTVMGGGYTADLVLKKTRAPITNEADNGLQNRRGTIAMASNPDHPHSANSQFFFNLTDNPPFDHIGRETPEDFGYCVFGEVISGMEVLDKMGQLDVHDAPNLPSCPKDPPVIQSIEQLE